LTPKNIHLILSLYFTIEQINRNIHVLPNISLIVKEDLQTISTFSNKDAIIPNYNCRHERRLLTVLTGPRWFSSITHFHNTTALLWPFHPLLSDCEHFPYLYQISPKDTFLSLAMIALMIHFGWNWVEQVISDDNPDIQFFTGLREEMHKHGVCLAFVNVITENRHQKRAEIYYNQIMTLSAKVIIIYGDTDSTLTVHFRLW
ncbi:hypothetical protein A6R68_03710, partial [Neotoma lepida]